jgi:hypothetical protein
VNDIACLIKRAALEAVEADKPAAVMYGSVVSLSPITVDVEQKLRLSGEQLTMFRRREFVVGGGCSGGAYCTPQPIVVRETGMQIGDTVVLLREQGGQRFLVLGVV